jgi:hypothetical protein
MNELQYDYNNTQPSDSKLLQMFRSIIMANNNIFYKSQCLDEPELCEAEKLKILSELYDKKSHVFLERYHPYISTGKSKLSHLFSNIL